MNMFRALCAAGSFTVAFGMTATMGDWNWWISAGIVINITSGFYMIYRIKI